MPIDIDVRSFTELNSNATDINGKVSSLQDMAINTVPEGSNNKIAVRRSSSWSIEGEEAYNGQYQEMGSISGEVALELNATTSRTAILATVTGYTFVTSFGSEMLTSYVYKMFIKQDSTGNHSVRWPYGASVLNMVGPDPNQITAVYVVKLPNGKIFVKCEAFQNTAEIGNVIKEFEAPAITFPDSNQAPMTFTWLKTQAVAHGGLLANLYSDWEIADDILYTNLLFSSYGNTIDLYSIQVVLTQAGQIYMRTRYGGDIGGIPVVSSWDEHACEVSGIDGDRHWDHVIYYLPMTGYDEQYHLKELKGNSSFITNSSSWIRIKEGDGPQEETSYLNYFISSGGSTTYVSCDHHPVQNLGNSDFCIEFFGRWNSVPGTGTFAPVFCNKRGSTTQCEMSFSYYNGKIQFSYTTGGTSWLSLNTTFSPVVGVWYHIAAFRDNNILYVSVDGVIINSAEFNITAYPSNQPFRIFSDNHNANVSNFSMSHFRFTKGVSRYSSSGFETPPVPYKTGNLWWSPELTQIESDYTEKQNWDKTELVINGYGLANSTAFKDEALNKNITVAGQTKIDVTSDLSSIIFDGNSDYLEIGNTGDFNFLHNGLHPWTIEFWFNPIAVNTSDWIIDTARGSFGNNGILVGFGNVAGQLRLLLSNGGGASPGLIDKYFTEYTFVAGTLYHVAFTWDYSLASNNLKMFVNGVQIATANKSGNIPSIANHAGPLFLGGFNSSYPNDMFNGRIYSFRISRFLRYTGTFTVDVTKPYFNTKPKVENWAETSLLINALDLPVGSTDIRDLKGNQISLYGDTKVSVANGLEYINFDGSGDYLSCTHSGNLNLGDKDFTIECFILVNTNTCIPIFQLIANTGSDDNRMAFCYADGYWQVYWKSTVVIAAILGSTNSLTTGIVHHVAFVRKSGVFKLFIDGVQEGADTGLSGTAPWINSPLYIGNMRRASTFTNYLNGRIYGYRVSDFARYTSNFNVDLTNPYFPAYENSLADFWMDGNDYSKMTLSTGVSKIVDKSGNMAEAVQVTAISQPALVQNAQNGLMGLGFDGSNDSLVISSSSALNGKGFNVFFVAEWSSSDQDIISIYSGGNSAVLLETKATNSFRFLHRNPPGITGGIDLAASSGSVPYGQTYMGFARVSVSGNQLYMNDILVASGSAGVNFSSDFSISFGSLGVSAARYLNGQILEISFIPNLSDFWWKIVSGYLAHKWGLTDGLPATHPYKTGFPVEDSRTDDYWYATVLCINGTDIIRPTEIVDSSKYNKVMTYGTLTVPIDSSNKPYLNFDGSQTAIYFPSNNLILSNSNFTLEFFVYYSAWSSGGSRLYNANGDFYHDVNIGMNETGRIGISCTSNGTTWNLLPYTLTAQLSLNTLYHIALVRNGTQLLLFVNGAMTVVSSSLGTTALYHTPGNRSICGQSSGPNRSMNGRLYSARVTKGTARYTENFEVDLANPYFPKKQNQTVPTPVHQYLLNGDFSDSIGGLDLVNAGLSFATDAGGVQYVYGNGTTQYATSTLNPYVSGKVYTYSMWFSRAVTHSKYCMLFGGRNDNTSSAFGWWYDLSANCFGYAGVKKSGTLDLNVWQNVIVEVSLIPKSGNIWLNNVSLGAGFLSWGSASSTYYTSLQIGGMRASNTTENGRSNIAMFEIYDGVLNDDQRAYIFNKGIMR